MLHNVTTLLLSDVAFSHVQDRHHRYSMIYSQHCWLMLDFMLKIKKPGFVRVLDIL